MVTGEGEPLTVRGIYDRKKEQQPEGMFKLLALIRKTDVPRSGRHRKQQLTGVCRSGQFSNQSASMVA